MRSYNGLIGAAALGFAIALTGAPLASADDGTFVRDTRALGADYNSVNLISAGQSACYFLSLNRDPGQVADRVGRYMNLDAGHAHSFLVLSVNEYCPQFRDRVGA